MTVAQTILDQLGGNRFLAMTGGKNLADGGNYLSMRIGRNCSKANHLKITLNGLDLYKMEFLRYTKAQVKVDAQNKAISYKPDQLVTIKTLDSVCCDQLQEIFTGVTGMYTRL